jgi:hypothetical protein
MEVEGAIKIFGRSVINRNLRYTTYIGDGDTKSYQRVVASNPYPGFEIKKAECVGHVQKRCGARLRTLRINYRGKLLSDGKPLSGKGRLTDKVINRLQNYYGLAIRQNTDSLYQMKKAVGAIIFHCCENDDSKKRHELCPVGAKSWCKYNSDLVTGKNTYKSNINIPQAIAIILKPIFSYQDLANEKLLEKCLHGKTRNVNESLNGMIWTKCSKRVLTGKDSLEMAAASAVICFNEGSQGLLPIYSKIGIVPGKYTLKGLLNIDVKRVREMNKKSAELVKKRRKKLRSIKKGYNDNTTENEGECYASGSFT